MCRDNDGFSKIIAYIFPPWHYVNTPKYDLQTHQQPLKNFALKDFFYVYEVFVTEGPMIP